MGVHRRGGGQPALQPGAVPVAGAHDPPAPGGALLRSVGAELAVCGLVRGRGG